MPTFPKPRFHGEIELMAGIAAGVVGAAEVNSQPSQTGGGSMQSPATWATIWFIVSVLYLLGIYYGMISLRRTSL